MKTNANVLTTKGLANNGPAKLKTVSVNPALHPSLISNKRPAEVLSIKGYELRQWLEHLTSSEGLYFIDSTPDGIHSVHFKHHSTGELMELEQQLAGYKEYMEALLFDLALFPDTPILAFDASLIEKHLRKFGALYYERAKEIDLLVGRLVDMDMRTLFKSGIYHEPRIEELTVDGVYQAFFPGTSRSFKEQGSYAMYFIYQAVKSILHQVIGRGVVS